MFKGTVLGSRFERSSVELSGLVLWDWALDTWHSVLGVSDARF